MAEPDAPQFNDRSTPEPLDDLELQAPLLVAPPLGINRQFLVPLGARSLTVLEPDLFQPRSSHADSSLFGDSPFFHDPLLAAPSQPTVQSSPSQAFSSQLLPSSADGLSSSVGESVQRSPVSPEVPTVSVQASSSDGLRSQSSAPLMDGMNQPDGLVKPTASQHSDQSHQPSISAADGLVEITHDQPGHPTARRAIAQNETPSFERLDASAASVEAPPPQQTLPFQALGRAPTIEPAAPSIPLLTNEVQRSTRFETQPEPIAETGSALAVDSQPDPTAKAEAASAFMSSSEQISELNVESAFISKSEQISESIGEAASSFISDTHPQATVEFKPEAGDRTGMASTIEPTSVQRSDSTIEGRPAETAELPTSSSVDEAISDSNSELSVASSEENTYWIAPIQGQTPVFSPSSPLESTASIQRSQPLQPFSAATTTTSAKPEIITDQAAQEHQSIALPEQEIPPESTVQRSLDVPLSTVILSNELAQTPTARPSAESDRSIIESFTTHPSVTQASVPHQTQSSSTASVSNVVSDSGNAAIAPQPASSLASTSPQLLQAKELQAKELELSPSTIDSSASELSSVSSAPSAPTLEQADPFLSEPPVLQPLELQTTPPAISESTPPNSYAAPDPTHIPSTDVLPLVQATPSLTSDPLRATQEPLPETTSLLDRSTSQTTAEIAAIAPQTLHESLLEVSSQNATPSVQLDQQTTSAEAISASTSADQQSTVQLDQQTTSAEAISAIASTDQQSTVQLNQQTTSTEAISAIASTDQQSTIEPSSLEPASKLSVAQTMDAVDQETLQRVALNHQPLPQVARSQTLEPFVEASPSKIEPLETESLETESLETESLENNSVPATTEATIQRTSTTPLELAVSETESFSTTASDVQVPNLQAFNSPSLKLQPFQSQPDTTFDLYQAEHKISETKASEVEVDLQAQNIANAKANDTSISGALIPDQTSDSRISLESPPSEQQLNFEQVNLAESHITNTDSDLFSGTGSQSELSFIQAKELTASESKASENWVSETSSNSGVDPDPAPDKQAHDVERDPTVQSSSLLPEEPQENLHPSLHLSEKSLDTSKLSRQPDTQNLEIQSLEAQDVELQSFEQKGSDVQNLEMQNPEVQRLEPLSAINDIEHVRSPLVQASINPSTSALTASSDTIARTLNETNQSVPLSEATINLAHTETHSTHVAPHSAVGNLDAVPHQDIASNSPNHPVEVNLEALSTQNVAQKRDVPESPPPSINTLTQETLQTVQEMTVPHAVHSSFSQLSVPEQAISERQPEPLQPLATDSKDIVSSHPSATVQRSQEAAMASRHTTSDTAISHTATGASNQALFPQVQPSPEDQTLLDVQHPVQSTSDAVPARPITQVSLPSEMGTAPEDDSLEKDSLVAQADGVCPDAPAARASVLTNHETIAHATTIMRSPEPPSAYETPSLLETAPVLPLEPGKQETPTTRSEQSVESFLHSPQQSEQENEPDHIRSVEAVVADSAYGAEVSSTQEATIADTPTISLQRQAVQVDEMARTAIATSPTANPSPTVETPQQQVTPLTEATIQPFAADSLETPQRKSLISPQVTPLANTAIQPFAADPLETGHSELFAAPSAATVNFTAQAPQVTEPSLTQAAQAESPHPSHQNQPLSSPSTENPSPQSLERLVATDPVELPIQRQVMPIAETAFPSATVDLLDTPHHESLSSPSDHSALETTAAGSLISRSPQTTEASPTQSVPSDWLPSWHPHSSLPSPSPETLSRQKREDPIASETPSQALSANIAAVETAHETVSSAIVQRLPGAAQPSTLGASNVVNDEITPLKAPVETTLDKPTDETIPLETSVETTLDSPTGDLRKADSDTAQPERSTAIPLVLQKLSTLEPLISSVNLFGQAAANPPMVQASSANSRQTLEPLISSANLFGQADTNPPIVQASSANPQQPNPQQPNSPSISEVLLQPKQTVKVDRPATQWSGFSDLVQRQVTPSARSSNRSITESTPAQHSVAAVLASTSERIQRQETQPAEVRISRDAQTQSTAAEPSQTVDAKDLEQLAQVIYQQLRQRLRIEQERHGRDGAGRLPW